MFNHLFRAILLFVFITNTTQRVTPQEVTQEKSGHWQQVAKFEASEAKQAAAADHDFVYVITNAKIAKYDRQTQQLVATSSGEAEHLNSGYLWKDKIWCAHSNYPQTPERSEIKVLDPQAMRIETGKEFGNYGGSLTWVVRKQGCWWCNFARYGENNHETFLVQFDDQWQELRRWTYPDELIQQLGRYSLSGGVWLGDELLVSGHDAAELYRLRLPKRSEVLEYLGKQECPFYGQGFAIDPANDAMLVGIRRSDREVVFARKK